MINNHYCHSLTLRNSNNQMYLRDWPILYQKCHHCLPFPYILQFFLRFLRQYCVTKIWTFSNDIEKFLRKQKGLLSLNYLSSIISSYECPVKSLNINVSVFSFIFSVLLKRFKKSLAEILISQSFYLNINFRKFY